MSQNKRHPREDLFEHIEKLRRICKVLKEAEREFGRLEQEALAAETEEELETTFDMIQELDDSILDMFGEEKRNLREGFLNETKTPLGFESTKNIYLEKKAQFSS